MGTFCLYFSTEILIGLFLLYLLCFYNFAKPVLISDLNKIIKLLLYLFCVLLTFNIFCLGFLDQTSEHYLLLISFSFIKFTKLTNL
jgi:hypothetical protein